MNRRQILRNLRAGLAMAGGVAITAKKQAKAQTSCGPVQKSEATVTQTYQSQCSQQTITATLIYKTTVQSCTNADGSVLYTIHTHSHGTAQGYDPVTGQVTNYVVNEQERGSTVIGVSNAGGCPSGSSTQQYRELFISKGSAPNEQVVVTQTFSMGTCGANCCGEASYTFDPECQK